MKPPVRHRPAAFSLLELLAVVAIMGILSALAIPAFVSIARGTGMKRAVAGLSDAAELARAEAMARSTWVWLGLKPGTNSAGNSRVLVSVVASRDGTTNTAGANLSVPFRPFTVENIKLVSSLTGWGSNAVVAKDGDFSFTVTVAGAAETFSNSVIAFSPQGEALLKANQISPWLEIGIRETRGIQEIPERDASIRISGPSGQTMVAY